MANMEQHESPTCIDIVESRLHSNPGNSFLTTAEEDRPWSLARTWTSALGGLQSTGLRDILWDEALMRTYDRHSGSVPDSDGLMLASDPDMRLTTVEERRTALETHANHGKWEPTPYISFTSSSQIVETIANTREEKDRGSQYLVVVDPRVRFELKMPVLRYADEMLAYHIDPPYIEGYWTAHYLYLWEVLPAEVVGMWSWEELRGNKQWFQDIITAALESFRARREQVGRTRSPEAESQ